jgi:hypothetical protein
VVLRQRLRGSHCLSIDHSCQLLRLGPLRHHLLLSYTTMPGRIETPNTGDAPARRGVYLLTHPRSASNLFQTMMAKQPGYQSSGYKVFDAGFASLAQLHKGRLSEWSDEDRKALYGIFRAGFDKVEDELADARKNVSPDPNFLFCRGKRRGEVSGGSRFGHIWRLWRISNYPAKWRASLPVYNPQCANHSRACRATRSL